MTIRSTITKTLLKIQLHQSALADVIMYVPVSLILRDK